VGKWWGKVIFITNRTPIQVELVLRLGLGFEQKMRSLADSNIGHMNYMLIIIK